MINQLWKSAKKVGGTATTAFLFFRSLLWKSAKKVGGTALEVLII